MEQSTNSVLETTPIKTKLVLNMSMEELGIYITPMLILAANAAMKKMDVELFLPVGWLMPPMKVSLSEKRQSSKHGI
jgi:hypothetical protein